MATNEDKFLKYNGVKTLIKHICDNFARLSHTHTKKDITDFPTSMPASDVSDWAKASTKPTYTKAEVGLANVENKSSATIRSEITKTNVTSALGYTPYTPNEVDNKLSALETNIDWKESVATYDDIAKTYPKPDDGWTVNVKDTDYTYRYNGTSWVAISANAIPKATNSVDGLLTKEDHTNYEDANSKKHTHSNKSVLDGITSTLIMAWNAAKTHADSAHARTDATKVEKSTTNGNIKINGTETNVYTHPSGTNPHGTTKSDVGLGNVGNFKAVSTVASQGLTDSEKSNARANIGAQVAGSYASASHSHTKSEIGLGNVDNTADVNKSVNYANTSGSSTKATSVVDYGNTENSIQIGFGGAGATASNLGYIAGYLTGGKQIKDVSKDVLKSWLGLGSLAYSSATIPTIPSSLPANGGNADTVNGHTVNSDVPANAKFTDTDTWRPQPDWNATTGDAVIKNKPTIPSVGNGTVTIKQNGSSKGTFTMNQSGNTTIELTDTNTDTNTWNALKGATTSQAGTAGYAPAPAAGAANRYLRSDGTWSVPPDTNTTYSDATTTTHGLMSTTDKTNHNTMYTALSDEITEAMVNSLF